MAKLLAVEVHREHEWHWRVLHLDWVNSKSNSARQLSQVFDYFGEAWPPDGPLRLAHSCSSSGRRRTKPSFPGDSLKKMCLTRNQMCLEKWGFVRSAKQRESLRWKKTFEEDVFYRVNGRCQRQWDSVGHLQTIWTSTLSVSSCAPPEHSSQGRMGNGEE